MKILVVNTGSTSKKYALFDDEALLADLHFETIEKNNQPAYLVTLKFAGDKEELEITPEQYQNSLYFLFDVLSARNIVRRKDEIDRVGIRVVAPGLMFQKNSVVDAKYIKALQAAEQKAPLHLGTILAEIAKLKKFFGKQSKIIGVSDSTFHASIPDKARHYAIHLADARKHEIYRYGYHGISMESIVYKLKQEKKLPKRLIVCHLGGGASITAIKDGQSFDTTMGFTPLEGLSMANRVGDVDAGAIIYLAKKKKMSWDELMKYLNKQGGLFGLSGGLSAHIPELLTHESNNSYEAKLALEHYVYKIQKQIGAFVSALGGVDMIVFSATVGERSAIKRERICDGLNWLGVKINKKLNHSSLGIENTISSKDSKVVVRIIKTDETSQIARIVRQVLLD